MRPIRRAFVAAFTLAAAPAVALAQRGTPNPERAAVQQVIVDFAAHVQAGKLELVDSLFRRGGVHILTDNATTHGWAEYRDAHLKPELARFTDLKFAHAAIEPVVRETVAWVAFRQELSGTVDGKPATVSGRATAVMEKLDGRWRIVHLHVSR